MHKDCRWCCFGQKCPVAVVSSVREMGFGTDWQVFCMREFLFARMHHRQVSQFWLSWRGNLDVWRSQYILLIILFVFALLSSLIPLKQTWKVLRKASLSTELPIFILWSWRVLDALSFCYVPHCQGVETFTICFKWQMSPSSLHLLFPAWSDHSDRRKQKTWLFVFLFSQDFCCSGIHQKSFCSFCFYFLFFYFPQAELKQLLTAL